MISQKLDRPWTINTLYKTVPGAIPETSTVKRKSVDRFPRKTYLIPLGTQAHPQAPQSSPRHLEDHKKTSKMDPQKTSCGTLFSQKSTTNRPNDRSPPRTLKASQINQKVTPDIHISLIGHVLWRYFEIFFGKPKRKELQSTLQHNRASQTQKI